MITYYLVPDARIRSLLGKFHFDHAMSPGVLSYFESLIQCDDLQVKG
jgi:hypothetical protein